MCIRDRLLYVDVKQLLEPRQHLRLGVAVVLGSHLHTQTDPRDALLLYVDVKQLLEPRQHLRLGLAVVLGSHLHTQTDLRDASCYVIMLAP